MPTSFTFTFPEITGTSVTCASKLCDILLLRCLTCLAWHLVELTTGRLLRLSSTVAPNLENDDALVLANDILLLGKYQSMKTQSLVIVIVCVILRFLLLHFYSQFFLKLFLNSSNIRAVLKRCPMLKRRSNFVQMREAARMKCKKGKWELSDCKRCKLSWLRGVFV